MIQTKPLQALAIEPAMKAAYLDEHTHAEVWMLVAEGCRDKANTISELRNRKHLGASDLDQCALAKWASFHVPDMVLPFDFQTQYTRLDLGSLVGILTGALVKVGGKRVFPPNVTVRTEVTSSYSTLPANHTDILLEVDDKPYQSTEVKSSYWPKGSEPEDPLAKNEHWVIQTCTNALGNGAPIAALYVVNPSLFASFVKKERVEPIRTKQFEYDPLRFKDKVDIEVARMTKALDENPPECDAKEPWRARTCRYVECPCRDKA